MYGKNADASGGIIHIL